MNQKAEIEKSKAEIKVLSENLERAEQLFTEKFSKAKAKRDEIYSEITTIYAKIEEMKLSFVSPITNDPKRFVDGYSLLVSEEITQKAREMGVTTTPRLSGIALGWFRTTPYMTVLQLHINSLWAEINVIETKNYRDLQQKIDDLKRKISSEQNFLNETLMDVGKFRAYAKAVKDTTEQKEEAQREAESLAAFEKWFKDKYQHMLEDSFLQNLKV